MPKKIAPPPNHRSVSHYTSDLGTQPYSVLQPDRRLFEANYQTLVKHLNKLLRGTSVVSTSLALNWMLEDSGLYNTHDPDSLVLGIEGLDFQYPTTELTEPVIVATFEFQKVALLQANNKLSSAVVPGIGRIGLLDVSYVNR